MYKKKISSLLAAVIVAGMVTGSMPVCVNAQETTGNAGTTYYVDAENGDDSNSGTSIDAPWKSLNKVTDTTFLPGDQILLKSGSVWNGEWLWPKGSGVEGAPIIIDKYGGEEKPIINGMGIDRGLNYSGAVHLRNQEYWEIRNLEITNDDDFDEDIDLSRPKGDNSWSSKNMTRNGILLIVDCDQLEDDDDGIMDHIYIENCYVHDVDGPNDWNDTFTGGIIFNVVGSSLRPSSSFNDLRIAYNTIRKVDLLGVTGYVTTVKGNYQDGIDANNMWMTNVYIGHNYFEDIAQGAIDLCDAKDAVVEYNVVDGFLKRYPNFRPTVALYPWKCENAVFQFNEVYNGPSTNADGSPYDMDSGLKDVVYQFNYSHNNPCGWMLYMGKNNNDIIRYNISDDGGDYIIKYFLTACETPTYFLNNVIIYDGERTKFMHRDPFKSQTYFYNNVFYNKSTTTTTTWHDTARYLGNLGAVTFSNNCFYEASGIHSKYEPADAYKVTENPKMVNPGQKPERNEQGILSGATIWDGYKIGKDSPLVDAGIYEPQMGTMDFFGNQLYYGDAPDIGVYEVPEGEYNAPPVNLAVKASASANNFHVSFDACNVVDGDDTTRWASADSTLPIWLELDFGEETTFNELIAKENIVSGWASARIAKFELQKWNGTEFEKFYESSETIGESAEFVFPEVTTTKLRFVITGLKADTTLHGKGQTDPSLKELELYYNKQASKKVNLVLNKEVITNNCHNDFDVSWLNDGKMDTRWASANSELPIEIEFNLGSDVTFNTMAMTENIVANWATPRIESFQLQAWDGTTYQTIFENTGEVGERKEFAFEDTTAQKIRLVITALRADTSANSAGQTDPSIAEFELYRR